MTHVPGSPSGTVSTDTGAHACQVPGYRRLSHPIVSCEAQENRALAVVVEIWSEEMRTTLSILHMGKTKYKATELTSGKNPWPRENYREVCRIPTLSQSIAWQCLSYLAARGNTSLPQRKLLIFLLPFWELRLNFSLSRFSFPLIYF